MMQKCKLLELPFPSTTFLHEPILRFDVGDLLLLMDFDDEGVERSVRLRFVKTRAHRHRAEVHCTAWHAEDAYDAVSEVLDSDWVEELRAATGPDWRDYWVMRHFMIYVDSFASLEVVAESVTLEENSKNSDGT